MVRWLRWYCPPDTGFEIRALAVWGRARYLSVTEAPHNTNFHTWMGKKQFCFFQTAETGNRTPDSGVKGSGANHYPRAPAPNECQIGSFSSEATVCIYRVLNSCTGLTVVYHMIPCTTRGSRCMSTYWTNRGKRTVNWAFVCGKILRNRKRIDRPTDPTHHAPSSATHK